MPIDFTAAPMRERFNHMLATYARLKAGVSIDGAQRQLDLISRQLQDEVVLQNQRHGAHVIALRRHRRGMARRPSKPEPQSGHYSCLTAAFSRCRGEVGSLSPPGGPVDADVRRQLALDLIAQTETGIGGVQPGADAL